MYGAYGQGGQQQQQPQYGYNQQQQPPQQYGAPQQQYQYQQQQSQYTQQPQQTQQQPVANNVNVVQPEQQQPVESSKPAPIYVDTQHDDMVRFFSFLLYYANLLKKNCYQLVYHLCFVFGLSNLLICSNFINCYKLVIILNIFRYTMHSWITMVPNWQLVHLVSC